MQQEKKKVKLLYLGNKLAQKNRNLTHLETLSLDLANEGYQVKSYSSQKFILFRLLAMCLAIIRYRKWADYVLIDTYSTTAFWYAYFVGSLSKILNIQYVCILHGGNLPQRLLKNPKLCQQLFGSAYKNIAPSHYLLHHFQEAGFTNLTYIPNTIEITKYKFKQREQLNPKLLYVRSFAHIYNPILALKVLKELLKSYPEAALSMVGPFKDDSINECKAYANQHQLPVTFTGGMQKEEWLAYAQDFYIFVNTTNVDNTPVSVIEAMALGLPVVTTNVGGIPYLIQEDEALLVPPNNVEAMTSAVQQLLENPQLTQQLSLKSRKKVEAFDWQKVKHRWFELLE